MAAANHEGDTKLAFFFFLTVILRSISFFLFHSTTCKSTLILAVLFLAEVGLMCDSPAQG